MPFQKFGESLGLAPALLKGAAHLGYAQATPVQAQAIPPALQGRDLRVTAATGSGKTAAFALPLLNQVLAQPLMSPRRVKALVLVPTRELAAQVGEVVRSLAQFCSPGVRTAIVFGGVSINPQMMSLRGGADIVVATPGRLLDLVEHNALRLDPLELLVLDEADRLLESGFADELSKVMALLPAKRQNLLFSATFPETVQTMAAQMLHDPVCISVEPAQHAEAIILQRAIAVDTAQRTPLLRHLFKSLGWRRALVFVATKYTAELISAKLYKSGIYAAPFHGDLSQGARTQVLEEFKDHRWDLLITTDLAARGIDIAQMPVVINYDLPRSATDYVHRIGRTGRAGESGLAITFVTAESEAHFRLIEKRQGLALPREIEVGFEPQAVLVAPVTAVGQAGADGGGIKGKRPSKKDKLRAAGLLPAVGPQKSA